jgi:hypothetical protein
MLATLCLLTGIFASGQAEGTSEWLVVPRLNRGQELVYWGTYAEEAIGRGAKFARHYQLETRVLVQETHSDGAQVALFTAVKFQGPPPLCISPQSRGEIQRGGTVSKIGICRAYSLYKMPRIANDCADGFRLQ